MAVRLASLRPVAKSIEHPGDLVLPPGAELGEIGMTAAELQSCVSSLVEMGYLDAPADDTRKWSTRATVAFAVGTCAAFWIGVAVLFYLW